MNTLRPALAAAALLMLAALPVHAAPARTTAANLLDRIQIEDFLADYYQSFGASQESFDTFFTQDGVIDVNGRIYTGQKGVAQAYKEAGEANRGNSTFTGKFVMLLNNPRIVITGDTAVVDAIWTGVVTAKPADQPHFAEQGKERDELVKVNGQWMMKKRIITSIGGLAPFYQATFKDR